MTTALGGALAGRGGGSGGEARRSSAAAGREGFGAALWGGDYIVLECRRNPNGV